jgi:hypothetical protein
MSWFQAYLIWNLNSIDNYMLFIGLASLILFGFFYGAPYAWRGKCS